MPLSKELLDQLLKEADGKDLFGPGGLLKELTGRLAERMLEGEMTDHLGYSKHSPNGKNTGNSRNGHTRKTLKGEQGTIEIKVPRDRDGSFEPKIIPKHQRRLPGFDEKVIALYARGMSVREIAEHLQDLYQVEVSPDLISTVTDAVMEDVRQWQNRPLDALYPVVFLDALFTKVRRVGGVRKCAVYVALGIDVDGRKDVLGLWMADEEKASFWLGVLTELKSRGMQDVIYCCVDGLTGFESAIEAVYPHTLVQQCIVHLVRASLRYVSQQDRKAVAASLREIYTAPTVEKAEHALKAAKAAWPQYPHLVTPWEAAWSRVIPFFSFVPAVRRILYTTNAIESLNRQLRRVLKTRGAFVHEDAVRKVLYLALINVMKKWTVSVAHWREAMSAFSVLYPDRIPQRS